MAQAYTRAVPIRNAETCVACTRELPVGLRIVRSEGQPHHMTCAPPAALQTGHLDVARFVPQ